MDDSLIRPDDMVALASRTLLAAGYDITGCQRHPYCAEIACELTSKLGALIRITVAITDQDDFTAEQRDVIIREADSQGRAVAFVARYSGDRQASWQEFLDAMGGAVPTWRALAPEYSSALLVAAKNQLPPGSKGEAWRLFEDLVADGLEFTFGRRARRLGGRKRGVTVSDILAQLPDGALVVADAKAYAEGFSADWASLRALVEYVRRQKERQRGHNEVFGALVVAGAYKQEAQALAELSPRFIAETGCPIAFLQAKTMANIIAVAQSEPHLRNAIRWRLLLGGGLLTPEAFERESNEARSELVRSPA